MSEGAIRQATTPVAQGAAGAANGGRPNTARTGKPKAAAEEKKPDANPDDTPSTPEESEGDPIARGTPITPTQYTPATSSSALSSILAQQNQGSNLGGLGALGGLGGFGGGFPGLGGSGFGNGFGGGLGGPIRQPNIPQTNSETSSAKELVSKIAQDARTLGTPIDKEQLKALLGAVKTNGIQNSEDIRRLAVHGVDPASLRGLGPNTNIADPKERSKAASEKVSDTISNSNEAKLSADTKTTLAKLGISSGDFHQATVAQYQASAKAFEDLTKPDSKVDTKNHVLLITGVDKDGNFDHSKEIAQLQAQGKTVIIAQVANEAELGKVLDQFKGKQFGTVIVAGHGTSSGEAGIVFNSKDKAQSGQLNETAALDKKPGSNDDALFKQIANLVADKGQLVCDSCNSSGSTKIKQDASVVDAFQDAAQGRNINITGFNGEFSPHVTISNNNGLLQFTPERGQP